MTKTTDGRPKSKKLWSIGQPFIVGGIVGLGIFGLKPDAANERLKAEIAVHVLDRVKEKYPETKDFIAKESEVIEVIDESIAKIERRKSVASWTALVAVFIFSGIRVFQFATTIKT